MWPKKKKGSATGLSQRRPGSQNSRGRTRLVLNFLLFLFRAPAAGKGQARGGGPPCHLPETALSSLLFSPASRPPSLFLHLLLPHLAPSGVLSCSPCFVSPPQESKGPWGQSQAPQSPRGELCPPLPARLAKAAAFLTQAEEGAVGRSTGLDLTLRGSYVLLWSPLQSHTLEPEVMEVGRAGSVPCLGSSLALPSTLQGRPRARPPHFNIQTSHSRGSLCLGGLGHVPCGDQEGWSQ